MSPLFDDVSAKIENIRRAFATQREEQQAKQTQQSLSEGDLTVSLPPKSDQSWDNTNFSNFNDFHNFNDFQNFNEFHNFQQFANFANNI